MKKHKWKTVVSSDSKQQFVPPVDPLAKQPGETENDKHARHGAMLDAHKAAKQARREAHQRYRHARSTPPCVLI